ncbi:hypothetical protein MPNT_10345 [Candidatus Methylacidithermus pantelleriae]|uniref:Uncharacterized protein n=1 Tax=Candidatus Methylacidithermus pantelleriae TaxID=2744239 RepID=A0A8J2FN75_9BACT|nr:hypothetical protein MPNT_10345 [Candidatus Methylacidithermus pantelleriae]
MRRLGVARGWTLRSQAKDIESSLGQFQTRAPRRMGFPQVFVCYKNVPVTPRAKKPIPFRRLASYTNKHDVPT